MERRFWTAEDLEQKRATLHSRVQDSTRRRTNLSASYIWYESEEGIFSGEQYILVEKRTVKERERKELKRTESEDLEWGLETEKKDEKKTERDAGRCK